MDGKGRKRNVKWATRQKEAEITKNVERIAVL